MHFGAVNFQLDVGERSEVWMVVSRVSFIIRICAFPCFVALLLKSVVRATSTQPVEDLQKKIDFSFRMYF